MSDHPWPEHIPSLHFDRSAVRLEALKDLKLFQNYNRLYHKNRMLYKEHMNSKMASLWTNRFPESGVAESLKPADDHYVSFAARQRQEFQPSISELRKSRSGEDFDKTTEENWQQRVAKRARPADWTSDQEDHGLSWVTDGRRGGLLPKVNSDQEENKRVVKVRQFHAKQEGKHLKWVSAPTGLPNINKHSNPGHKRHNLLNRDGHKLVHGGHLKVSPGTTLCYSGHSDGPTASSMLNKFRYFIRMKNKTQNKSTQIDESVPNRRSQCSDVMNSPNPCADSSLNQIDDSLSSSLDSTVDNNRPPSPTVTTPNSKPIDRATSLPYKQITPPNSEETNKGAVSKAAELRPAQALHKVIFRTRDEKGVLVITAIGINQAALMR